MFCFRKDIDDQKLLQETSPLLDPIKNLGSFREAKYFKIFLTVWAFAENLIFAGLRAGWPALVYILKQEGIYENLCQPVTDAAQIHNDSSAIGSHVSPIDAYSTPVSPYNTITHKNSTLIGLNISWNLTKLPLIGSDPSTTVSNLTLIGCEEQDAMFNKCFTIATAMMAVSALLYGQLNYKFGIRAPRIVSVVIFITGSLCIAFIDKDYPWLVFPGLLLISAGGMALYITNNQVSYMYSTGGAAVIGLLCGALEASSFVMTLIKIAFQNGVSLKTCFSTLAGLYLMTMVSTLFFLPRQFIKNKDDDDDNSDHNSNDKYSNGKENTHCDVYIVKSNRATAKVNDVINSCGDVTSTNKKKNTVDKQLEVLSKDVNLNANSGFYDRITVSCADMTNEDVLPVLDDKVTDQAKTPSWGRNEVKDENTNAYDFINKSCVQHNTVLEKDGSTTASQCCKSDQLTSSMIDKANVKANKVVRRLLSKTFLLYLLWATVVQLILAMCLGTFNPWLVYVTGNEESKVSEYTDILLYSMLASPALALGAGLLIDCLQRTSSQDEMTIKSRTLFTAIISLATTSVLGVLVCACVMTLTPDLIHVTCVMVVVFRTALYSCGTAFLRLMYPTDLFGVLCGVMTLLAGGFSFLQYPLFLWIQARHNGWREVYGLLCVLGIASLVQPLSLHLKRRRYEDNRNCGPT